MISHPSGLTGVIQSVTPTALSGSGSHGRTPSGDTLDQVCKAYQETIMAVLRYKDDYDEPLAENLATEVSDDLATAYHNG